MKLLLTSSGIKNTSIHNALGELLGKPIAESSALYIPTAIYPFPGGAAMAWRLIRGPLCELGWKSLGCWSSPRSPVSRKTVGFPCFRRRTPC